LKFSGVKKKVIGYKSYHDYIVLNAVPGVVDQLSLFTLTTHHFTPTPLHTPQPECPPPLISRNGTVQKPLFSLLPLENGGEQSLEGLQGGLNLLQLGVCGLSPFEQFFLLVDLQDLVLYLGETFLKAVARQVMIISQTVVYEAACQLCFAQQ